MKEHETQEHAADCSIPLFTVQFLYDRMCRARHDNKVMQGMYLARGDYEKLLAEERRLNKVIFYLDSALRMQSKG